VSSYLRDGGARVWQVELAAASLATALAADA